MNSERLDQLLKFLKEEPDDPFNLYAIATEYSTADPHKALMYYELLLDQHPDYLPTYYHIATLYVELGKDENARLAFDKGIKLAQEQKDFLSLRELQNAYNEFLFEN